MTQQADFAAVLQPLHLLNHPFYQDWMAGKLSLSTLQDYAGQYFSHVKAFPRYLSAIHSQCENDQARQIILENLNDEEGVTHGTSHPELWLRFAEGLGQERSHVEATAPRAAINNVVSTFFSYAKSSFHEGLGALYAYEAQVPEIAGSKIEGLQKNYGVADEKTLSFFKTHQTADVYHREAVEGILANLSPEHRQEALVAAKNAAQALWDFLTEVHSRETYAAA